MKNKFTSYLVILLVFAFQFCNQNKDNTSEKNNVKQEINILLTDPVETLDPMQILYSSDWKVAANIFETLVSINENNKIVPELAKSFTISKDKLEYTFHLRKNVHFHDSPCFSNGKGRKLNAWDVQYTFERLANKKNDFPNWQIISGKIIGIENFYNGKDKTIKGITVKDSLTISFLLTKPFAPFLKILTSHNFSIVPKEAVEYFGNKFSIHPVGTGPFRISEFRKYKKIQLVKNENYYLEDNNNISLPYIHSICYRTIDKTENVLNAFITNKSDIIEINNKNFIKLKANKKLFRNYRVITVNKGNGVRFWGFNFNGKNKLNKVIRTAIAESFDRKKIVHRDRTYKFAETLVPEHFLNYKKIKWQKFDGKYIDTKELSKKDSIIIYSSVNSKDLIEMQNAIKKSGLVYKTIIKPDNYYRNISKLKPDLFRVSMFPSYPDPIEYYSLFYSKNSDDFNLGGFSNKMYDEIYEKILFEFDENKLLNYYIKLEEILKEEAAAIYLTHQGVIYYVIPKNLNNVKLKYIQLDFRKAFFK